MVFFTSFVSSLLRKILANKQAYVVNISQMTYLENGKGEIVPPLKSVNVRTKVREVLSEIHYLFLTHKVWS